MFKPRILTVTLIIAAIAFVAFTTPPKKTRYVVIGYVGGYKGLFNADVIDVSKLTHINYAFVNVQHNRAWLTNERTDTANFRNLVKLKKKNPELKILTSIGGWSWSKNFSDMALRDTSRKAFAQSAVAIIRRYQLDGIDIDWEYPDDIGAGNIYREADKHNYTLMFEALRAELNVLEKETNKKLLLTAAVGGFKRFLQHTEMDKVASYLNYINLMTYDYFQDSLGIAVHHTSLYASKAYVSGDNADRAITDFITAGVPHNKLVMGLAFYGRSSRVAESTNHGLGVKTAGHMQGGGYTFIKDSLMSKKEFRYYRDTDAMAPYLFNSATKQFISYDDEWSVKNKCNYVKSKGLAGVMFWEYDSDRKGYLLKQVAQTLQNGY